MKRRARSDEQKQGRKQTLLDSSMKLFAEQGYNNATIEAITADCDLSPAAFYLYFDSKFAVYRMLHERSIEKLQTMFSESLLLPADSSWQRIERIAWSYCRYFKENPELYELSSTLRLPRSEYVDNSDLLTDLENKTKTVLSTLDGIIGEGLASGEFRPVDTWRTAVSLWGTIDGIIQIFEKRSASFIGTTLEDLLSTMLETIRRGLQVKP